MRIEIQYFKYFEFGEKKSLSLDVDPESLVSELKNLIFFHIKIQANHQELYIKLYDKYE